MGDASFNPLQHLPGEFELGQIIRAAVDFDPNKERMYLTCSVGELAQRIARASPPAGSSEVGDPYALSDRLQKIVDDPEYALKVLTEKAMHPDEAALLRELGQIAKPVTEAAPADSAPFDLSLIPVDLTGQWLTWLFADKHKAREQQVPAEQFDMTSVQAIVYWWEKYKRPEIAGSTIPVTGAAPVEASVMGIPVVAHKGMTPDMVAFSRVPPSRVEASAKKYEGDKAFEYERLKLQYTETLLTDPDEREMLCDDAEAALDALVLPLIEASAGVATDELCIRCGKKPKSWVMHRNPPGRVCWASCVGVAADVELEHDEEPERNPVAATDLDLTKWHPDFIPCSIDGDSPDGGHCRSLRNDERIIITAGQLRHMGAKPEIWPEYEEPATGRYDEIADRLAKQSIYHDGSFRSLLNSGAVALREAQQRIAELETKS